jgi:hypothetical protein
MAQGTAVNAKALLLAITADGNYFEASHDED